jgi:hypothetical protein
MHIPDFPRMAVTWDLEKSTFMIYEKANQLAQDHDKGCRILESAEEYCRD